MPGIAGFGVPLGFNPFASKARVAPTLARTPGNGAKCGGHAGPRFARSLGPQDCHDNASSAGDSGIGGMGPFLSKISVAAAWGAAPAGLRGIRGRNTCGWPSSIPSLPLPPAETPNPVESTRAGITGALGTLQHARQIATVELPSNKPMNDKLCSSPRKRSRGRPRKRRVNGVGIAETGGTGAETGEVGNSCRDSDCAHAARFGVL